MASHRHRRSPDRSLRRGLLSTDPSHFVTLTRLGPNGVSLFFAISGFLICSHLIEEEEFFGTIDLKGFYIRRACRILPAAFAYLGTIALLAVLGFIAVTPVEWWSSVCFFRNYLSSDLIHKGWGGYTIHYWSLAVEEHFYLFWPAAIAWAGRGRARYIAGGLAVGIACWRWLDFQHGWVSRVIPGLLFPSRTDVRLDGLLLGCLAALLVADKRYREWLRARYTPFIWYCFAIAYVLFQVIPRRHLYTIWESALLASLVAGTVINPEMLTGRIFEFRGLKLIGRLSYSLYLWQQLFLVPGALYPVSLLQKTPYNLAAVFGMAGLSYQFVERPLIKLGHRLAPPPTPGRSDLGTST